MSAFLQSFKGSNLVKLCFAIIFFTSGLIINCIQCVLYICVRSWNKRLYRKINSYLCTTLFAQLVFLGNYWSGVDIIIYADKDDFNKYWGKEHAYLIMNHRHEIDWLLVMMLADRMNVLGNSIGYGKKAHQYLPIIGWAWKLSDYIMLERSFGKDKERITIQLKELVKCPDPMWFLFCPEGTRMTPDKHKASEDFAQQKNLPKLKYHLQPRTRGFTTSIPIMKGKVPAIYDMTLIFRDDDPVKPTLMNLLMGKATTVYWYMNRIPMENVPESEIQQEKFLRNLFVQKDKMVDSFEQTGDIFTTSGVQRVTPFRINPRRYVLYNVIAWAIATLCPLMYWLIKLLISGQILYIGIGLSVIVIYMGLLYRSVSATENSKGSSYGTVKAPK